VKQYRSVTAAAHHVTPGGTVPIGEKLSPQQGFRATGLRVHRGLEALVVSASERLESAPSKGVPRAAADPVVILGRIHGIHSNGGIQHPSPVAQRDHGISGPTTASAVQERSVDGDDGPAGGKPTT
jgi:hypothetical protein